MTTNPHFFAFLLVVAIIALAHWLNRFTWWRSADDKLTAKAILVLLALNAGVLYFVISTGLTE